jgi:hypothetical protein
MCDRPRERPRWPPEDGAYDYLDQLSEHEFGWEFLRRNPEYEKDALRAGADRAEPKQLPTGQFLWRLPLSRLAARKWSVCPFRRSGAAGTGCPFLVDGACRWPCT